jgi:glycosyltransferase involved in cell wall biosynthesis
MRTLTSPARAPERTDEAVAPVARRADSVICFGGEDWWYHNRGHYDMRMMRALAGRLPVLYINSIGMRIPNPGEGARFARRIGRKLRSFSRGFERVEPNFSVFSPVAAPAGLGGRLARAALAAQVRGAAEMLGSRRPLLWVACPPAAEAIDSRFEACAGLVYQRTDRYECFPGVDQPRVRAWDLRLKAQADLTVFCARALLDAEQSECRDSIWVDHGVDYAAFARAGAASPGNADPADVHPLPRPRIGFIGGIDAHTFDPALLTAAARALPDASFILVGACSLPGGWCAEPNVHLLGPCPLERVPAYMAACDVLIMPWRRSAWIESCNPVKLREYLAVGRPVVSTPFAELERYAGLVRTAGSGGDFVEQVRRALREPHDPRPGRLAVEGADWGVRAQSIIVRLQRHGVVLNPRAQRRAA